MFFIGGERKVLCENEKRCIVMKILYTAGAQRNKCALQCLQHLQ